MLDLRDDPFFMRYVTDLHIFNNIHTLSTYHALLIHNVIEVTHRSHRWHRFLLFAQLKRTKHLIS